MELKQEEAEQLFLISKKSFEEFTITFPSEGDKLTLELYSDNKRYQFQLDINRKGYVKPKLVFQNRYNKIFILRRLDIIGAPHTNPPETNGIDFPEEFVNAVIPCPHLHFYFEGFNDKWALPLDKVTDIVILEDDSPFDIMIKFLKYCNIEEPNFDLHLFQ
jgi:hypothetical protein